MVVMVLKINPCAEEQIENGEQPSQFFFPSLLEVCAVCSPFSHLSKTEQGTIVLNKM
jgi:hypothetical protein